MLVHKVILMLHKVILIWYCLPSAYKAVLQEALLKQHLKHARLVKAFQSSMHYLMILGNQAGISYFKDMHLSQSRQWSRKSISLNQ